MRSGLTEVISGGEKLEDTQYTAVNTCARLYVLPWASVGFDHRNACMPMIRFLPNVDCRLMRIPRILFAPILELRFSYSCSEYCKRNKLRSISINTLLSFDIEGWS